MRTILKKALGTALLALSSLVIANAQNQTIVGNPASTSATAVNSWVNTNNTTTNHSRSIIRLGAAELNRLGFVGGAITSIAFDKVGGNAYTLNDIEMRMWFDVLPAADSLFPSGARAWANDLRPSAVQVINSSTIGFPVATGWTDFQLSTPYVWDGVSTLVVFTEMRRPAVNINPAITWRHTNTPSGVFRNSQSNVGTNFSVNTTPNINRPNVRLTWVSPTGLDAALAGITSPSNPGPIGSAPITVNLANFGDQAITQVELASSVNGQPGPTFTWNGSLPNFNDRTTVTIGNANYASGSNTTRVWITAVNGAPSTRVLNDTNVRVTNHCNTLAGTYTIDNRQPASATNFTSFNDLAAALNTCGISGPTTVNVAPGSGPYTQTRFRIENSPAPPTATNRLTINGNGVLVSGTGTATVADRSGVFVFINTGYVTLNGMNVELENSAPGGNGIGFYTAAPEVTVSNSVVRTQARTGTAMLGIFFSNTGGTVPNTTGTFPRARIFNNRVEGFYTGIGYGGDTNRNASKGDVIIRSNEVKNFTGYGIYVNRGFQALVDSNVLYRDVIHGTTTSYGIYMAGLNRQSRVAANRIYGLAGPAGYSGTVPTTAYGIYMSGDAVAGQELNIVNNIIGPFLQNGNTGLYGIYTSARSHVNIYHNTIVFDMPASTSTGVVHCIWAGTTAASIQNIRNNIMSYDRGGTGIRNGFYGTTSAVGMVADYNLFHIPNPGTTPPRHFIYTGSIANGGYLSTVAAAAASRFGANSDFDSPEFASYTTGDMNPTNPVINDRGTPVGVTTDFTNAPRSTTNPDFGALEFQTVGVCQRVINLRRDMSVSTSIVLLWDIRAGEAAVTKEVQYGPARFAIGSGTLVNVGANDNTANIPGLLPGTEYDFYVRRNCVDGTGNSGWSGPLRILVPLLNDEPCGALPIPVESTCNLVTYTNLGATFSSTATTGIQHPGCSGATQPRDVWFTFTTNATGAGSNDAIIGVYGFSVGQIRVFSANDCNSAFTQVACATRFGSQVQPLVVRNLTPSTRYYVMMAGDINNDIQEPFNVCISSDIANSQSGAVVANPMTVMPNPARGRAIISGDLVQATATVQVFSATGQLVISQQADGRTHELNLDALPKGVYQVKVSHGGAQQMSKLVVE